MFVAFDIRPTVAHLVRLRRQEEADAPYALASVTVLSIQRFLIGARTNLAHKPAAIVITAAVMNTAFHEPIAESTEASGTTIEAVPLAVYSVPALAAAYLLPNVSAQVAGKIEKGRLQKTEFKAR
jgi:hypothetical protein